MAPREDGERSDALSAAEGEVRSGILGLLAVLVVAALVFGTHAVNAEFVRVDPASGFQSDFRLVLRGLTC